MAETLYETVEGPLGKAELYEVATRQPNGTDQVAYEVRCAGQVHKFPSLGEAYIAAGELAGKRT